MRNLLAHRYLEVDYGRLLAKAREAAERTAPEFAEWVKRLLAASAQRQAPSS